MNNLAVIRRIFYTLLLLLSMNTLVFFKYLNLKPLYMAILIILSLIVFIAVNTMPCPVKNPVFHLRSIRIGHELIILFSITFILNTVANIYFGMMLVPEYIRWWMLAVNIAVCLLFELVILINGLLRVFLTSVQLGIKWRLLLFFFWWVPVVNIFILHKVCRLIRDEYAFEAMKNELDETRKENEICRTKYPLLLVHGVFFRDFRYFSYWGRIPKALKKNGAEIHLGEQQSAASVKDSGTELAARIKEIANQTGCEKVNIIAHSKGGLDARYAVGCLGADKYVASVTTINTPHHGCNFADALIEKTPNKIKESIARKYNAAMSKLGDENPDFISAVTDLTAENCKKFNSEVPDSEHVYYQSVASKMNKWTSGKFPLNVSHVIVRPFDGDNDGLVSVESAGWGQRCTIVSADGKRGISHGDVIDLNRENIDGFDVRELYVDIVKDLKAMGI